ncbi:MAG: hypothetical protein O3C27_16545 [Actinomycetota bacterium]|nr:hypothetical protein [Actinomycetota bacterium]
MTPPKSAMTNEHKAALAEGRRLGRTVRAYLEALETNKPKRGRKRTSDSVSKRLDRLSEEIETADPLRRLQLIQERLDLQDELERMGTSADISSLEAEFIQAARPYAERKNISYAAFRELGVDAAVLKKAGISRG